MLLLIESVEPLYPLPKWADVNDEQLWNALLPISATLSGMVTEVNPDKLNAPAPMLFSPAGNETCVMPVICSQALSAISVTVSGNTNAPVFSLEMRISFVLSAEYRGCRKWSNRDCWN